jgi:hypothetical protein
MQRSLTHKLKQKYQTTIRAYVRGVEKEFPIQEDGAQLNAEMNQQNTQNKRRKIVDNAKLEGFEPWQMKIFAKNAKQGWRFFQPDTVDKPTPRSSYEAWKGTYQSEDQIEKDEKMTNRIMLGLFFVFVIALAII